MATLLFAGSVLFGSCQKDQLATPPDEEQALLVASKAKKATDQPPSSSNDEAFDQELDAVMHSWMERMNAMEMTCEPDVDFANMMIMHHLMGVDAANVALKYEHHGEAIKLTEKSRDANLKSTERLRRCLAKHGRNIVLTPEQCAAFKEEMMREMMLMQQAMERALHENDRNDVDLDFSEVIIQHHQGAIKMSAIELEYGHDQCMRSEADRLIDEQAKEIEEFSEFKNEHIYGTLKH
ncbi:DUF305 domain-containing protein [Flavisolibacter sp. BT320]|nr:DUF305 domain-containing protein [Flavisolibacter longurius]